MTAARAPSPEYQAALANMLETCARLCEAATANIEQVNAALVDLARDDFDEELAA